MNVRIKALKILEINDESEKTRKILYKEFDNKILPFGNYAVIYSYIKISDQHFRNLFTIYKLNFNLENQEYDIDKTFIFSSEFNVLNYEYTSKRHHPEIEIVIDGFEFSLPLSDFNNFKFFEYEHEEFDPNYRFSQVNNSDYEDYEDFNKNFKITGGQDLICKIAQTVNNCLNDGIKKIVEKETVYGYNSRKTRKFHPTENNQKYLTFNTETSKYKDNYVNCRYEIGSYFAHFISTPRGMKILNAGTSENKGRHKRQATKIFVNENELLFTNINEYFMINKYLINRYRYLLS